MKPRLQPHKPEIPKGFTPMYEDSIIPASAKDTNWLRYCLIQRSMPLPGVLKIQCNGDTLTTGIDGLCRFGIPVHSLDSGYFSYHQTVLEFLTSLDPSNRRLALPPLLPGNSAWDYYFISPLAPQSSLDSLFQDYVVKTWETIKSDKAKRDEFCHAVLYTVANVPANGDVGQVSTIRDNINTCFKWEEKPPSCRSWADIHTIHSILVNKDIINTINQDLLTPDKTIRLLAGAYRLLDNVKPKCFYQLKSKSFPTWYTTPFKNYLPLVRQPSENKYNICITYRREQGSTYRGIWLKFQQNSVAIKGEINKIAYSFEEIAKVVKALPQPLSLTVFEADPLTKLYQPSNATNPVNIIRSSPVRQTHALAIGPLGVISCDDENDFVGKLFGNSRISRSELLVDMRTKEDRVKYQWSSLASLLEGSKYSLTQPTLSRSVQQVLEAIDDGLHLLAGKVGPILQDYLKEYLSGTYIVHGSTCTLTPDLEVPEHNWLRTEPFILTTTNHQEMHKQFVVHNLFAVVYNKMAAHIKKPIDIINLMVIINEFLQTRRLGSLFTGRFQSKIYATGQVIDKYLAESDPSGAVCMNLSGNIQTVQGNYRSTLVRPFLRLEELL